MLVDVAGAHFWPLPRIPAALLVILQVQCLIQLWVHVLVARADLDFSVVLGLNQLAKLCDRSHIVVIGLHFSWLMMVNAPELVRLIQLKVLINVVRHLVILYIVTLFLRLVSFTFDSLLVSNNQGVFECRLLIGRIRHHIIFLQNCLRLHLRLIFFTHLLQITFDVLLSP